MADVYNNTNNLYWVFTNYGKQRLASLTADDYLFLYNARIGCYNWYEDPLGYFGASGYSEANFKKYFESEEEKDIGLAIADGKLSINTKNLVEEKDDEGNTISRVVELSITVPETLNNFDIREMAIYETVDGVDHLFAICTMQPIPKPSTATNHFISAILTARLQSEMLADAYDQILLDPNNNFVTSEELTHFEENLLFVETNLAEQVSNNSRIIGYNRPQQLYEQLLEDKRKYSNFAISTMYANALGLLSNGDNEINVIDDTDGDVVVASSKTSSLDDIKAFWVFQPTNDATAKLSIADLSYYGNNLATDKMITLYENGFEGLAPWVNFEYDEKSNFGNYYTLNSDVDFDLVDTDREGNPSDTGFTFFFVGAQNSNEHNCTLMAKDNSAQQVDTPPAFCFTITDKRQVRIRLYQDSLNYVEYLTGINSVPEAGTFYVVSVTYNPTINDIDNLLIPRFSIMINGKDISGNINRTGNYQGMPKTTLPLTSRISTANDYTDYVDSKISLMALVKANLGTDYIRVMTYNLMALIGVNPCLIQ